MEGYDACRKIAILSSLAYGAHVNYENIYTEGITRITAEDMKYASLLGMKVKLLATSKRKGEKFYAMVCPELVGKNSPLYSVNGVCLTQSLFMEMYWETPCSTAAEQENFLRPAPW